MNCYKKSAQEKNWVDFASECPESCRFEKKEGPRQSKRDQSIDYLTIYKTVLVVVENFSQEICFSDSAENKLEEKQNQGICNESHENIWVEGRKIRSDSKFKWLRSFNFLLTYWFEFILNSHKL